MNKIKIYSFLLMLLPIMLTSACTTSNNTVVNPSDVQLVEVKHENLSKDYPFSSVNQADAKILLAYVNAAVYSSTLNDGRMMKRPPNDYVVRISLKSEEELEILIWDMTLLRIENEWYNIDTDILDYKLSDIKDILEKYSQTNAVTTD